MIYPMVSKEEGKRPAVSYAPLACAALFRFSSDTLEDTLRHDSEIGIVSPGHADQ